MCVTETLGGFLYLGMYTFGELILGNYRATKLILLYPQEKTKINKG